MDLFVESNVSVARIAYSTLLKETHGQMKRLPFKKPCVLFSILWERDLSICLLIFSILGRHWYIVGLWKLEQSFRKPERLARSDKWNLMKCGILSTQKKKTLGHQGSWPWHTENCGLGARQSWYRNLQTLVSESETLEKKHILYRPMGSIQESVAVRTSCRWQSAHALHWKGQQQYPASFGKIYTSYKSCLQIRQGCREHITTLAGFDRTQALHRNAGHCLVYL